jgi:hypothetical protein
MKKIFLFLFFIFVCSFAFSQSDVNISTRYSGFDIVRNANWTTNGIGGLQNNFIINSPPTNSGGGLCVGVTNNDVSTHNYNIEVGYTSDVKTTGFQSSQTKWSNSLLWGQTGISNLGVANIYTSQGLSNGIAVSQLSGTTLYFYTPSLVASTNRIVVKFLNGTGSSSTADVFAVQGQCAAFELKRPLYGFSFTVTGPAASSFLGVVENIGYIVNPKQVVLSCTGTNPCDIQISSPSNAGTCTLGPVSSLNVSNAASASQGATTCTVPPLVNSSTAMVYHLATNSTLIVPFNGEWLSSKGIEFVAGAGTYTTTTFGVNLEWYEQ